MRKRLFATINDGPDEIVLERATPSAPWAPAGVDGGGVARSGPGLYSVPLNGRVHRVVVVKEDPAGNSVRLGIGGRVYTVRLQGEEARLMTTLGMGKASAGTREVKAPMPGLVLNVLVKPGDTVRKNDPLVVLEAMKMENVIRATGDAVVGTVAAVPGKPVEKGQLLVGFA